MPSPTHSDIYLELAFELVMELAESAALDSEQNHWATKELAIFQQKALEKVRDYYYHNVKEFRD